MGFIYVTKYRSIRKYIEVTALKCLVGEQHGLTSQNIIEALSNVQYILINLGKFLAKMSQQSADSANEMDEKFMPKKTNKRLTAETKSSPSPPQTNDKTVKIIIRYSIQANTDMLMARPNIQ